MELKHVPPEKFGYFYRWLAETDGEVYKRINELNEDGNFSYLYARAKRLIHSPNTEKLYLDGNTPISAADTILNIYAAEYADLLEFSLFKFWSDSKLLWAELEPFLFLFLFTVFIVLYAFLRLIGFLAGSGIAGQIAEAAARLVLAAASFSSMLFLLKVVCGGQRAPTFYD